MAFVLHCRSIVVILLGLSLACGGEPAPIFRAGAAKIDITPKAWPVPLIGNFSFRPATSAHDPLHSRAIVLDDGSTQLAIAVVDSCYVARRVLDRSKQLASDATAIPTSRMLISATHTHTAPPAAAGEGTRGIEDQDLSGNEAAYGELLVRGIADSIIEAHRRLEPAEAGWASTELADEVFNRRWHMKPGTIPLDPHGGTTDLVRMNPPRQSPNLIRPTGPTDPEIMVLSIRTAAGKPLALLANYSLHYVGGIPPDRVSADYFGEFARQIADRLGAGDGFVGILSNGASGDINNIDFSKPRPNVEPFEQVRKVAGKVADRVFDSYPAIEHRAALSLAMAERELTLGLRRPTEEGYESAKRIRSTIDHSRFPRQAIYAQRAIDAFEGPESVDVKLQALRIGGLGIAALPFETFVEIGLELKSRSPLKPTFTIELANGAEKYLPTPEQHELGGYETWLGTNIVEKQASVKITKVLFELLNEIAAH